MKTVFKNALHSAFRSDNDAKDVTLDTNGDGDVYYPLLDTATMLSETTEEAPTRIVEREYDDESWTMCDGDDTLNAQFERFVEWHEFLTGDNRTNWFELGQLFMEKLGFYQQARDNTYNNENDLSSDFVYEVWTETDDVTDWIYNDTEETVAVIYPHHGGDARGNYGAPVFLRSTGEYTLPLDWVCQFYLVGMIIEGEYVERSDIDEPYTIDEEWQTGYASSPFYHMSKQFEDEAMSQPYGCDEGQFWATMKGTGQIVKVAVSAPYYS